ncbi:hypothetical protein ACEQ8H_003992 [Pleosporales sp. CAS-2024a]
MSRREFSYRPYNSAALQPPVVVAQTYLSLRKGPRILLNFHPSHGLSLISTGRAASAIAAVLPDARWSGLGSAVEPFEVRLIPGKGFGMVATQFISKTTTILLDPPRVIASAQLPSFLSQNQGQTLFDQALKQLAEADRELVLGLDKSLGGTDMEDILKTNTFSCQLHDGAQRDSYMCLFPLVARINHACRPNAHARFIPKTLLMEIKALRDIKPGEEIAISYGRIDLQHVQRQQLYKQGWNFTCTCDMCTASAHDMAASDQRRARFAQLRKKLENLTPETYNAQQIVGWEKEIMELSGKEGLDLLLAPDFERLAYVYAGHCMVVEARTWAMKARETLLEWTVVEDGLHDDMARIEELLLELKS